MRKPEYVFLLGLYGRDELPQLIDSKQWSRWYDTIVVLAEYFDLVLTDAGYKLGAVFGSSAVWKDCSLKRSDKKLRRILEKEDICTLELESMFNKPQGYVSHDWDLYSDLTAHDYGRASCFGIDLPRFRGKVSVSLLDFLDRHVRLFNEYVNATYGFAAVMTRADTGYPIGLASTDEPDELVVDCNKWSSIGRRECDRTIRNVHGINLLSDDHLAIKIGNMTLRDWIESTASRGRLERFNDKLTLWSFMRGEDDYEALHYDYPPLVKVRDHLKEYGVFAWWPLPE